MNKKIILVGPAAAGKDYLKNKFKDRGFKCDVSYTTRSPREGEINGIDFNFISEKAFKEAITTNEFYEWVKHGHYYYGTGIEEWDDCNVFIMETEGIRKITPEDRKDCFIIYLNPLAIIRQKRMIEKRNWDLKDVLKRTQVDKDKFDNFHDYDLKIINSNF